jgi:tetratricopeptide (TPR) repeat protein
MAKTPAPAISRLEAEIARQPNNAALFGLLARVHGLTGSPAKEEQTLRQAVSVDPRFTAGYEMLAQLYLRQRRTDDARAEFEAMAQRDPSAVVPKTMMAMLLDLQGKRDEAKKVYEATVRGTDNAPVAANNLAFIYAEEGTNLDEALQLATSAKQRLPNDAGVDDTIGWVYYKKGMTERAISAFEESLKKRPDHAEVLFHLALAQAKLGENAKARLTLERALKLNPRVGGDEARRVLASVSR